MREQVTRSGDAASQFPVHFAAVAIGRLHAEMPNQAAEDPHGTEHLWAGCNLYTSLYGHWDTRFNSNPSSAYIIDILIDL